MNETRTLDSVSMMTRLEAFSCFQLSHNSVRVSMHSLHPFTSRVQARHNVGRLLLQIRVYRG